MSTTKNSSTILVDLLDQFNNELKTVKERLSALENDVELMSGLKDDKNG